MDEMATIKLKLHELDVEFGSEENGRTGRLKMAQYESRRRALLNRFEHLELEEKLERESLARAKARAPSAAPVGGVAVSEKTASFTSEKLKLTEEEAKSLETFISRIKAARDSGNFSELRTIAADEEYEALAAKRDLATACEHVMGIRKDALPAPGNESYALLLAVVSLTRDVLVRQRQASHNFSITKARIDTLEHRFQPIEQAVFEVQEEVRQETEEPTQ